VIHPTQQTASEPVRDEHGRTSLSRHEEGVAATGTDVLMGLDDPRTIRASASSFFNV